MYTLIIDGNFFLRRRHSVSGLNFIDNPEKDRMSLIEQLAQSFSNIVEKHENYVNRIIMVRDYGSWRKHVNAVKPLEMITEDTEDKDYKANRVQDADTDWSKVYSAFDDFCNVLSEKFNVPIHRSKHAEGDDLLYIDSRLLNKNNIKVILWTSDGDAVQVVNDKTVLYRMPKEILYVDKDSYELRKTEFSIFKNEVDLLDSVIKNSTEVAFANVPFLMLNKIIQGDPKDNVPPLFRWQGGSTNRKPNNTHIKKVFTELGLEQDTFTYDMLYDDTMIEKIILSLFKHSKQTRDIEYTITVFKSNRKLLCLNDKEIPANIINESTEEFKKIIGKKADFESLKNTNKIMSEFGKNNNSFFSQFENI